MSLNIEIPIISFENYLNKESESEYKKECEKAAQSLINYGVLLVKDPRVKEEYNQEFLDCVENYFEQDYDTKLKDSRPEYHYQVGVTPGNIEDPKCKSDLKCQELIKDLSDDNKPLIANKPDPKWRFFWSMGKIPENTKFNKLNPPPVIPESIPNWEQTMNQWGNLMKGAVSTLSEMIAIGLNLEKDTFTKMGEFGPHLLAPTGSDLKVNNQLDTILAGFHYDLNFLTIHGKSRFPGLHVWARNKNKMAVKVPDGHLLVQAGKQLEWLTGGKILAGYHEVIVNERTIEAIEKAKQNQKSLWRISSTLFYHVGSDVLLKPLIETDNSEKYPPILCGDYVQEELSFINLKKE